jgi:hypothetical protein
VTTQKHWRVDPVHRVPGVELSPGGDSALAVAPVMPDAQQRPRRSGAHARPHGRWLARAGGVFGPLLLSVCLFLGLLLFGLLPATARGQHITGESAPRLSYSEETGEVRAGVPKKAESIFGCPHVHGKSRNRSAGVPGPAVRNPPSGDRF